MLSDPDKRRQYDQFGHAAFENGGGGAGAGGFGGFDFGGGDMGDIFGDIFGDLFGGGRSRRANNGPMRGANLRAVVHITFQEAVFGCEKELSVARVEDCPDCKGSGCAAGTTAEICPECKGSGAVHLQQRTPFGIMQTTATCKACGGTGKIIHQPCGTCRGMGSLRRQRKVSANIPAGIDAGQSIVLRGLGSSGKNGGPAGDLLVTVAVRPHPLFKRDGSSVLFTLPISFVQAALGAEVEIPSLDGKIKYSIPEGTQTGTVFRLKDLGIPYIRGKGRGDEFVTVKVVTPENLGEAQKAILREFAKATGENLTPPETSVKKKHKK